MGSLLVVYQDNNLMLLCKAIYIFKFLCCRRTNLRSRGQDIRLSSSLRRDCYSLDSERKEGDW